MPMYQRKPFKAQQWNKPGDVPSWAYGKVTEREDGFEIVQNEVMKVFQGKPGDYICQRPDGGLIYICRKAIFEACNAPSHEFKEPLELAHDRRALAIFGGAMRDRMEEKRAQGRGGWWDKNQCSVEYLRELFMQAVAKGNMVDVANFAMMIFVRENSEN